MKKININFKNKKLNCKIKHVSIINNKNIFVKKSNNLEILNNILPFKFKGNWKFLNNPQYAYNANPINSYNLTLKQKVKIKHKNDFRKQTKNFKLFGNLIITERGYFTKSFYYSKYYKKWLDKKLSEAKLKLYVRTIEKKKINRKKIQLKRKKLQIKLTKLILSELNLKFSLNVKNYLIEKYKKLKILPETKFLNQLKFINFRKLFNENYRTKTKTFFLKKRKNVLEKLKLKKTNFLKKSITTHISYQLHKLKNNFLIPKIYIFNKFFFKRNKDFFQYMLYFTALHDYSLYYMNALFSTFTLKL